MAGKVWKQLLLVILIVACLFNIVSKIVHKVSFNDELVASAEYVQSIEDNKNL